LIFSGLFQSDGFTFCVSHEKQTLLASSKKKYEKIPSTIFKLLNNSQKIDNYQVKVKSVLGRTCHKAFPLSGKELASAVSHICLGNPHSR